MKKKMEIKIEAERRGLGRQTNHAARELLKSIILTIYGTGHVKRVKRRTCLFCVKFTNSRCRNDRNTATRKRRELSSASAHLSAFQHYRVSLIHVEACHITYLWSLILSESRVVLWIVYGTVSRYQYWWQRCGIFRLLMTYKPHSLAFLRFRNFSVHTL
jgi:hypothetical protein